LFKDIVVASCGLLFKKKKKKNPTFALAFWAGRYTVAWGFLGFSLYLGKGMGLTESIASALIDFTCFHQPILSIAQPIKFLISDRFSAFDLTKNIFHVSKYPYKI
jgi:hypothetical protein